MTKLKLFFWILLALTFTVICGFSSFFVQEPLTPRNEYVIMTVIGSVAVFIVVGTIALITFFLLRKSHLEIALKRSFQVYIFLCLALFGVAYFKLPEAMKKRRNFEFVMDLDIDNSLHRCLDDKVMVEASNMRIMLTDAQQREITDFLFYSIQFNDKLIDRMYVVKNIPNFILNDSEVTQETRRIIDWELNTTK